MRMDPEGKKPRTVRRKAAGMGDNSAGDGYLDGQLLIAMPVMGDPRFERSVIYLCAHSSEGAMGIIVNRPAGSIDFPELLVQLDIIKKADQIKLPENAESMKVLKGGPVDTGRGFELHSSDFFIKDATLRIQCSTKPRPVSTGPPFSTFMDSAFSGSLIWSAFLMMSSCTSNSGKSMLPAGRLTMMPMAPSDECAQR